MQSEEPKIVLCLVTERQTVSGSRSKVTLTSVRENYAKVVQPFDFKTTWTPAGRNSAFRSTATRCFLRRLRDCSVAVNATATYIEPWSTVRYRLRIQPVDATLEDLRSVPILDGSRAPLR
jgi:hypothetical protein